MDNIINLEPIMRFKGIVNTFYKKHGTAHAKKALAEFIKGNKKTAALEMSEARYCLAFELASSTGQ